MYKFADLIVDYHSQYPYVNERSQKYIIDNANMVDVHLVPERNAMVDDSLYPNDDVKNYCLYGDNFAEQIIEFNGTVIHGSAICYEDNAFIFAGPSGAGKTTHTKFWQSLLGKDKIVYINDDKPALRIIEDTVWVYGTPFSGKTDKNSNIKVKVKAICFLQHSENNWITRVSKNTAKSLFLNLTLKGIDEKKAEKQNYTITRIAERVPMYMVGCLNDISAAEMVFAQVHL